MNNWQRLERVINWAGMSTNAFAKVVGLKRSENLYQIKRGNFGISKELAKLITQKYPMIDRSWLLTGEGSMMTTQYSRATSEEMIASSLGAIPYYQADVTSLIVNTEKPLCHLVLPMFKGATLAAVYSGKAMQPMIPGGSTVIVRETTVAAILPGEVYMVATNDFVVIRRIRKIEESSNSLLMVAENRQQFDDIVMPKNNINRVFLIVGVILNNQM